MKEMTTTEVRNAVDAAGGELAISDGLTVTRQSDGDLDVKAGSWLIAYIRSASQEENLAATLSVMGSGALRRPLALAAFCAWCGVQDESDIRYDVTQPVPADEKKPDTAGENVETVRQALEFSKGKVEAYERILLGRAITAAA